MKITSMIQLKIIEYLDKQYKNKNIRQISREMSTNYQNLTKHIKDLEKAGYVIKQVKGAKHNIHISKKGRKLMELIR